MTPTTQKRTRTRGFEVYEIKDGNRLMAVAFDEGLARRMLAFDGLWEAAKEMAAFLDKDFSHSMLAAKIRKAIAKAEK
jgi:hypothetical protein